MRGAYWVSRYSTPHQNFLRSFSRLPQPGRSTPLAASAARRAGTAQQTVGGEWASAPAAPRRGRAAYQKAIGRHVRRVAAGVASRESTLPRPTARARRAQPLEMFARSTNRMTALRSARRSLFAAVATHHEVPRGAI